MTYPLRLRLYGGRNVHAARAVLDSPKDVTTACGYISGPADERKPDDTPITCTTCKRRTDRIQTA